MPQGPPTYPSPPTSGSNNARQDLEYMAFHGQHTAVYERYKNIAEDERDAYQSTDILSSVIRGGIARLKKYNTAWESTAAGVTENIISDLEHDLDRFIQYSTSRYIRPRQLYECILDWSNELAERAKLEKTLRHLEKAEELNIRSYPDLYARLLLKRAELLSVAGRLAEAQQLLADAAERYYLIPDRNIISAIVLLLGQTSLLTGRAAYFKALLFSGMRHFYTRDDIRRLFTDLLIKTYRSAFRLLLARDVPYNDKALFVFHWLDHAAHKSWLGRKGQLDRLTRMALLGGVYFMNYVVWQDRSPRLRSLTTIPQQPGEGDAAGARRGILVTRAMGGIGDLLMMTPGLHALKLKFPGHDIHLAIPRNFANIFSGNDDIDLIDIESAVIDVSSYEKWFNITDCPAARIESRTMPEVTQSRIDIFSRSFGIRGRQLRAMDKRPRYFVSEAERNFQEDFWKRHNLLGRTVVGLQLQAAEPYRDYPHMADLVRTLAQDAVVLLFHAEKTTVTEGGSVIDPGPITLRQAFALAAACSAIVAPDSAFVHFAGALNIPCVALYGPIDGRIRTMHYPFCVPVDVRSVLRCVPCWRNEVIPCKLTNMRNSACMANISIADISSTLNKVLRKRSTRSDVCERKTHGI
jgi:ADP-heptose:LPS heptosyltransferase/predicted metal-dependent hydrolase